MYDQNDMYYQNHVLKHYAQFKNVKLLTVSKKLILMYVRLNTYHIPHRISFRRSCVPYMTDHIVSSHGTLRYSLNKLGNWRLFEGKLARTCIYDRYPANIASTYI